MLMSVKPRQMIVYLLIATVLGGAIQIRAGQYLKGAFLTAMTWTGLGYILLYGSYVFVPGYVFFVVFCAIDGAWVMERVRAGHHLGQFESIADRPVKK
jgi:hypothetical protein